MGVWGKIGRDGYGGEGANVPAESQLGGCGLIAGLAGLVAAAGLAVESRLGGCGISVM